MTPRTTGRHPANRSHAAAVLIVVLWLAIQILVPLVRKFELPHFRYRFATFSWAMFSHEPVRYSVTLFQMAEDDRREPIPGIDRIAPGFSAPDQRRSDSYRSVEQIQAWYTSLLEHIAARADGRHAYGVRIHWIGGDGVEAGSQWELIVPATEARP